MNLPTKLTLARVIMIPLFVAVYLVDAIPCNRLIALAIFALASFTDFLDGYIARKYNLVTNLGKFLDPIADKLLVNSALLLFILNDQPLLKLIFVLCAMIMISRELIIGAFRLAAVEKGTVIAADKLGKIKTVAQMIAVMVLVPLADITFFDTTILQWVGVSILIFATVVSIASLTNYIVSNRSVLTENSGDKV